MIPEFRAWDKKNEIYLYNVQYAYDTLSGFVKYDDGKNATYDESCFGDFLDNKRYDTEQFTGLKDVNGNKIFEGDIIKYTSEDGAFFYAEVKYFADDNYPAFDYIPPDEDWYFQSNCLSEGTFSNALEVVGNIHENMELLEVDK